LAINFGELEEASTLFQRAATKTYLNDCSPNMFPSVSVTRAMKTEPPAGTTRLCAGNPGDSVVMRAVMPAKCSVPLGCFPWVKQLVK